MNKKACSKCGKVKSLEEFYKHPTCKDGKVPYCKKCDSVISKNAYRKNKGKISAQRKKRYQENKEIELVQCKVYRKSNKAKIKVYFEENKVKIEIKAKIYRENNKEKIAVRNKKWRAENKEYKRQYNRKIRQTVKGRLEIRMGNAIRGALCRNEKQGHWEDLVGYSVQDLKLHLEKQFTDKMSWELFMKGEIHIDHIKPKSSYFYETTQDISFKECWALSNLQPLFAEDNLKKGDKVL